ncbi:type II toxin-antitoxin system RelE/ParE family toxin [Rhodopseudomonas parapalustris]
MRLVFDDRALDDLEQIFSWIAIDSPVQAERVVGRLFSSAELLLLFPMMGRLGQDPGTLEWVVPRLPYVLVYEVDEVEQRVIVTAVLHGARDREP